MSIVAAIPVAQGALNVLSGVFSDPNAVANRKKSYLTFDVSDDTGPMHWPEIVNLVGPVGFRPRDIMSYPEAVTLFCLYRGIGDGQESVANQLIYERRKLVNEGKLPQDVWALTLEDLYQLGAVFPVDWGNGKFSYRIEQDNMAILRRHRPGYPNTNPPTDVITGKKMLFGELKGATYSDFATKVTNDTQQIEATSQTSTAGMPVLPIIVLVGFGLFMLLGRK